MTAKGRPRLMTKELAEEIVMSGHNIKDCAKIYNISRSYAEKIIYGRTSLTDMKRVPPARRLNDDQVRAIRADLRPHKEIAEEYGIGQSMVSDIKTYTCYFDVPGPESRKALKRGANRKLTAEQVLFMLNSPKQKLHYWATYFNVSITTIFNALNGFSYPEVKEIQQRIADANSSFQPNT